MTAHAQVPRIACYLKCTFIIIFKIIDINHFWKATWVHGNVTTPSAHWKWHREVILCFRKPTGSHYPKPVQLTVPPQICLSSSVFPSTYYKSGLLKEHPRVFQMCNFPGHLTPDRGGGGCDLRRRTSWWSQHIVKERCFPPFNRKITPPDVRRCKGCLLKNYAKVNSEHFHFSISAACNDWGIMTWIKGTLQSAANYSSFF